MLEITTISTHKSDSGSTFKLQRKLVTGEHPTYLVVCIGRKLGDANVVFEGTYLEADDCLQWWLDGCPC